MARWIALLRGVNIPAWAKRSVPCQENSEKIQSFSRSAAVRCWPLFMQRDQVHASPLESREGIELFVMCTFA